MKITTKLASNSPFALVTQTFCRPLLSSVLLRPKEDALRDRNQQIHYYPFLGILRTIREVQHHVYVKRQTRICTTWPSFPFTCRLLFIISTHKLDVSRNFLSIRIVLSWFYPLIFYFEKFSPGIWRLPYRKRIKLRFPSPLRCVEDWGREFSWTPNSKEFKV